MVVHKTGDKVETQLWRLSEQNACTKLINKPLIVCLVPFIGDEHWCHASCPPWHQEQVECEGKEDQGFDLCHQGPHRLFGIFDVMNGKIEEILFMGRIAYQVSVYIGGCTDCGCVDVEVGIIHHPSCGWDLLGDFDSVPLALQALEEAGYALGSMLTLGQKTLWSRAEKADSF